MPLENILEAPAPGFRCYAAGERSSGRFLASVRHILNPPATSESIAILREMLLDQAEKAATFYQHHNGFILYRDSLSEAGAVELLPVEKWQEATDDMRDWFDHLADEPEDDPDHILTGISIATVPNSGNYFVMPVEGPTAGQIFFADHDGWYEKVFATDFNGFIEHLTGDPVKLITEELGGYVRYSDGKTDAQWIPEEYFSDVSKIKT